MKTWSTLHLLAALIIYQVRPTAALASRLTCEPIPSASSSLNKATSACAAPTASRTTRCAPSRTRSASTRDCSSRHWPRAPASPPAGTTPQRQRRRAAISRATPADLREQRRHVRERVSPRGSVLQGPQRRSAALRRVWKDVPTYSELVVLKQEPIYK